MEILWYSVNSKEKFLVLNQMKDRLQINFKGKK